MNECLPHGDMIVKRIRFGNFVVRFRCASLWTLFLAILVQSGYWISHALRRGQFEMLHCLASLVITPAWYGFPMFCTYLFRSSCACNCWIFLIMNFNSVFFLISGPFSLFGNYCCVEVLNIQQ
ncbi:hypothetical protein AABB24_007689 [Solanum stoloniferum]|uniref:Uncharacterized protein n=1 Tax=Solanum stoloniferum TaxID=62892 RepID=A0ABD2UQL8_9SOLN